MRLLHTTHATQYDEFIAIFKIQQASSFSLPDIASPHFVTKKTATDRQRFSLEFQFPLGSSYRPSIAAIVCNFFTRASVGGWVLNRLVSHDPAPANGLTINMCEVAGVASGIVRWIA